MYMQKQTIVLTNVVIEPVYWILLWAMLKWTKLFKFYATIFSSFLFSAYKSNQDKNPTLPMLRITVYILPIAPAAYTHRVSV